MFAALLACLLPAGIMVLLISRYGVNVPFWDEWNLVDLFEKAHAHRLSFADFFAQNNEHRVVFPKIIFLLLEHFTHWNTRAEMFFSVFLCALTALCLQWVLWRTLRLPSPRLLMLMVIINVLLFSPCQYENWLWGYQLACFLLASCLLAGVAVLCSELPQLVKFLFAGGCAMVATFSGGNGMLLWPLLLLTFLLRTDRSNRKAAIRWSSGWILIATCAAGLYFFHYQKPPWHPPLASSRNLLDYYCYISAFLGSPLGRHEEGASLIWPVSVGSVALALCILIAGTITWRRRDTALLRNAAPWISIGGFALLSSIMACITRIGFGRTQALESRYTTFSLLLILSLIPLGILVEGNLRKERKALSMRGFNLVLVIGVIALFTITLPFSLRMMRRSGAARARGHVGLTFLECFPEKTLLQTTVHPSLEQLTSFARRANSLHLLHPPLLDPAALHRLMMKTKGHMVGACGEFEAVRASGENSYVAAGWALLPYSRRPVDGVVLAYETADGPFAFALGLDRSPRTEVARFYRDEAALPSGWKATFRDQDLVSRTAPLKIEAWAFDIDRLKLCKLSGARWLD
ncbi:MAG: hypothetical protein H0U99_05420 [Chthoniobacterales bacterium]|nr:hypothetical protein [Chthoniobacterales bacterium]